MHRLPSAEAPAPRGPSLAWPGPPRCSGRTQSPGLSTSLPKEKRWTRKIKTTQTHISGEPRGGGGWSHCSNRFGSQLSPCPGPFHCIPAR